MADSYLDVIKLYDDCPPSQVDLMDTHTLFDVMKTRQDTFTSDGVLSIHRVGTDPSITYQEYIDALYLSVYSVCPAKQGPLTVASRKMVRCCQDGKHGDVEKLVDEGAAFPDVADEEGRTALFHASVHGHLNIVQKLIDNGCNVDALTDQNVSSASAAYHSAQVQFGRLNESKVALQEQKKKEGVSIYLYCTS